MDQISKIYGDQIKALRREKLIKRIYDAEEAYTGIHSCPDWRLVDGVEAGTINGILKSHDMSYYSYDIHTRCFDQFISKNRNYPALVYYSVNNHMYIVRERKKTQSLIESAKDIETKINTDMIEERMEEEDNSCTDRGIYEM